MNKSAPKKLMASGVSIERKGAQVIITASDEFEAELLEASLKDVELFALVLVTGALRKLPNGRRRFEAVRLVEALTQIGTPLPE